MNEEMNVFSVIVWGLVFLIIYGLGVLTVKLDDYKKRKLDGVVKPKRKRREIVGYIGDEGDGIPIYRGFVPEPELEMDDDGCLSRERRPPRERPPRLR